MQCSVYSGHILWVDFPDYCVVVSWNKTIIPSFSALYSQKSTPNYAPNMQNIVLSASSYPFMEPAVSPVTKYFWHKRNIISTGKSDITDIANIYPHCVKLCSPKKPAMAMGRVLHYRSEQSVPRDILPRQ